MNESLVERRTGRAVQRAVWNMKGSAPKTVSLKWIIGAAPVSASGAYLAFSVVVLW